MNINRLTSLLVSTFLVPSFGYAMLPGDDIRVSDVLNGRVPQNFVSSSSSSSSAKDPQTLDQLNKSAATKLKNNNMKWSTASDQVERFFGPITRQENATPELRGVVNAVCNFFEQKASKAAAMELYAQGQKPGEGFQVSTTTKSTFTSMNMSYGKHIALVREKEKCSGEISALELKQKNFPATKNQFDKKIESKQAELKTAQGELTELKNKETAAEEAVKDVEGALKAASKKLDELTPTIDSLNENLDALQASQASASSASSDQPAADLEVAAQLIGSLAPQAQERASLSKKIENLRDNMVTVQEASLKAKEIREEKEEAVRSIEQEIKKLDKELQDQQDFQTTLPQKIAALEKEKQKLQDKADTYALLKYVQFLNIYLALPNDDKSYYEQDVKLASLSPSSLPLLRQLMSESQNIDFENAKSQLKNIKSDAQYNKMDEFLKLPDLNARTGGDAHKIVYDKIKNIVDRGYTSASEQIICELKIPLQKLFAEIVRTDVAANLTLPPAVDAPSFDKQHGKSLNDLRADRIVKAAMEGWKRKISTDDGSLVARLGLDSYLFNKDFDLKKSPDFFSLAQFQKQFPSENGEQASESSGKNHILLGMTQLQTTHYVNSEEIEIRKRTDTIYNFLRNKQELNRKAAVSSSSSTSPITTSTSDLITFSVPQMGQPNDTDKTTKAILKYFSYANMAMALRYDISGQEVKSLQLHPLGFESLLKEPLTEADRLDNFLARKAIQWANKLQGYKDFIKQHSLNAYTFAPLDILEAKNDQEKS